MARQILTGIAILSRMIVPNSSFSLITRLIYDSK